MLRINVIILAPRYIDNFNGLNVYKLVFLVLGKDVQNYSDAMLKEVHPFNT